MLRECPCLLILLFTVTYIKCRIEEIPLPPDVQTCFNNAHAKGNLSVQVGEKVIWHCIHGTLWKRANLLSEQKIPPEAMKWFADLINKSYRKAEVRHRRRKRQAGMGLFGGRSGNSGQLRIRREYRMLSDVDRNSFHRALVMLKSDTTIPPNRFDALGRLHELLGDRSHDGPNFLGWHRFFLVVAENALREKVPGVTIPYWDSTLDGALTDPRASIIWTPNFMGNGNGRIRTGPFAGWMTPYGPLIRNFGDGGTMMNWTSIRDSFTRRHLAEILYPHAEPKYNLEDHHGEPHLWIGGHMSPQAMAGFDPIFLLHHSFIDLVWELFRRLQRRRGVDPTTDYPSNTTGAPGQAFNDPSGFGNLRNRHALSDIFTTEMYTYQLPPTCSTANPSCGSPYLRCDTTGPSPRCISASIFDVPTDQVFNLDAIIENLENGRAKRSIGDTTEKLYIHNVNNATAYVNSLQSAAELKCQPENINEHYVNNYLIDGIESRTRWSYIPVQVVARLDHPYEHNVTDRNVAIYSKCRNNNKDPYRVFIESNGINYRGFYKEIMHVQRDVSVYSSIGYIGVKTPRYNSTESIIAAYDSCGRVCQPYCRDRENGYHACAGAIRISPAMPLQYGQTVEQTSEMIWREELSGLPLLDEKQIFFKIVCNHIIDWPWV